MKNVLLLLALYLDLVNSNAVSQSESVRRTRQVEARKEKRIVCYYSSWAVNRSREYKFSPEDIDPHLCTHLLYNYGTVVDGDILPYFPTKASESVSDGIVRLTKLKKYNKDLKLILSLGETDAVSTKFSTLVSDVGLRNLFPKNARIFLQKYNFDGLDINWEFPYGLTTGSKPSDKENFVELLKGLREDFKDEFLLSITVPKYKHEIDMRFDIPRLIQYLDFMNVMSLDYSYPENVGHVAPLYPILKLQRSINVDATIQLYLGLGVNPGMINMGIALWGVAYLPEDSNNTDIGSRTDIDGPGFFFSEICDVNKSRRIEEVNKTDIGPYLHREKLYVMAVNDENMVTTKARYAANKHLGGIMFWSVDMDDFKGRCHTRTFPMIRSAREAFLSTTASTASTSTAWLKSRRNKSIVISLISLSLVVGSFIIYRIRKKSNEKRILVTVDNGTMGTNVFHQNVRKV